MTIRVRPHKTRLRETYQADKIMHEHCGLDLITWFEDAKGGVTRHPERS
jgi:hypothetical protein